TMPGPDGKPSTLEHKGGSWVVKDMAPPNETNISRISADKDSGAITVKTPDRLTTTYPNGRSDEYDKNGNKTKETDEHGTVTTYKHNRTGDVEEVRAQKEGSPFTMWDTVLGRTYEIRG